MEKNEPILDELDRKILKELQRDGRTSFRKIAEKLEIADGTVRFRINRLMEEGALRFSVLVNPFRFEDSILALIGLQLEARTHTKVMKTVAEMAGVLSVCNVTGEFDLLIEVFFHTRRELNQFLFERLPEVTGIKATHTYVYLDARNKWIEPAP